MCIIYFIELLPLSSKRTLNYCPRSDDVHKSQETRSLQVTQKVSFGSKTEPRESNPTLTPNLLQYCLSPFYPPPLQLVGSQVWSLVHSPATD